uniref:MULE transposase domain-containing protein n=1 Tax=Rhizophagus irregularis (strain DAOM 181602 / DAOM 197198 / MUCL 43194) TaxID=747089 RepID=U9STA6_RHIID
MGVSLEVIFSDSDPSLVRSIKDIYPNAQHLLCIFHIDLNLQKKLKGKLGSQFEEFCRKFYIYRNSLCEELFEFRWKQLVEQYPVAVNHVHGKVDRSTSLCNLLVSSINNHIKNDEHFDQVNAIIKEFLTPTMLRKQRSQMNQSVCYDISQITDWHHLMEIETDNEEISIGIREQEQDTRQIIL